MPCCWARAASFFEPAPWLVFEQEQCNAFEQERCLALKTKQWFVFLEQEQCFCWWTWTMSCLREAQCDISWGPAVHMHLLLVTFTSTHRLSFPRDDDLLSGWFTPQRVNHHTLPTSMSPCVPPMNLSKFQGRGPPPLSLHKRPSAVLSNWPCTHMHSCTQGCNS